MTHMTRRRGRHRQPTDDPRESGGAGKVEEGVLSVITAIRILIRGGERLRERADSGAIQLLSIVLPLVSPCRHLRRRETLRHDRLALQTRRRADGRTAAPTVIWIDCQQTKGRHVSLGSWIGHLG
jgi:hypothetical protein